MTETKRAINSLENGTAWGITAEHIAKLETENPAAAQAMRENKPVAEVLELLKAAPVPTRKIISIRAGRGQKVHQGYKTESGRIMMTCGCACSFTANLRETELKPTCKNSLK